LVDSQERIASTRFALVACTWKAALAIGDLDALDGSAAPTFSIVLKTGISSELRF
jgi:hypothetical protein